MKGRMRAYLSVVVVVACFAACAEPLAPAKEARVVRSVNQLLNGVTSETQKTGRRVLRHGRPDELVLDVANRTLSARGRTIRVPAAHLAMMVESFDGINALDHFFQALIQDPTYRESVAPGKKSNALLKVEAVRVADGKAQQVFAPMSVTDATPTPSSITSTDPVDVVVSGASCAELNATLSNMYTAFYQLKDNWEEAALAAAAAAGSAGAIGALTDPAAGGGAGAGALFAELAVIWAEILHMKLSISIFEGMMVAMGCVTVLPPVLVVPEPPPSSGGSSDETEMCYYHYRLWRSYDGGRTYHLVAESITIAPC